MRAATSRAVATRRRTDVFCAVASISVRNRRGASRQRRVDPVVLERRFVDVILQVAGRSVEASGLAILEQLDGYRTRRAMLLREAFGQGEDPRRPSKRRTSWSDTSRRSR